MKNKIIKLTALTLTCFASNLYADIIYICVFDENERVISLNC